MHSHHTTQQLKTCNKCQRELPATLEFFYADKRAKDGLQYRCKECQAAESKAWYRGKAEELKERRRENFKRWYQANREKNLAANKGWRQLHPENVRASANRRRSMKRNAPGSHKAEDVQSLYAAQEGRCAYCNVEVGDSYHVDHIVPLSRGGGNGVDNLAIACPPCNLSKHNKLLDEWTRQTGKLDEQEGKS